VKFKTKLPVYNGKILRDKVAYQTLNDLIDEKSKITRIHSKPSAAPTEE
jgi:hypothetical protein